ncbi:phenylacetate-coenzyme A ligase PaaK-like adenylate-forming protein [Paenibacillus sp. DS2015]|uniref:LuxE/PaaK family acyltransferase n=1 Tax=Paenibacillus sp. DS2015 TaxID=3373917 RepID=UPI003D1D275E
MKPESTSITKEILRFIEQYAEHTSANYGEHPTMEADYNELALRLFNYQFQFNIPYRKYCQARRKSPHSVRQWQQIPPLPVQAFKTLTLSCEPEEEAEAIFMTSGTTNVDQRGRNIHPWLQVWDASMAASFKRFVLPRQDGMTIFVLVPNSEQNAQSSLSRYVSRAVQLYGTPISRFFFQEGSGIVMEELVVALMDMEQRGEPILLMGATFSYVHVLDYLEEQRLRFTLPKGSIIFDTGGLKGVAREITTDELHKSLSMAFHVDREQYLNMYGMTELSSQLYDQTLIGPTSDVALYGNDKVGPGWIRTLILHPDTLLPVQEGEVGVLAHYDLANWNSSLAVLTEDLGYYTKDGLVLQGRVKGSEARGCSRVAGSINVGKYS